MYKFIITNYPDFSFFKTAINEEEALKCLALFLSENNLTDKYNNKILFKKFKNCLKEAKRPGHFIIEKNYVELDTDDFIDLIADSFLETKDFCLLISYEDYE